MPLPNLRLTHRNESEKGAGADETSDRHFAFVAGTRGADYHCNPVRLGLRAEPRAAIPPFAPLA